jgi:glycerophosphoryl diester phosphodiesterase
MIRVIGHRGVRQHKGIDENSLPAFEKSLAESDGLETDAVISADKSVYLCHEVGSIGIPHLFHRSRIKLRKYLNKASAKIVGKKRLEQLDDKTVSALALKNGECLPTLAQLFALAAKHPGKTFNIELKGHNSAEPVLKEIAKAIKSGKVKKEQIIISSFDHHAIAKARALAPELKYGLICSQGDRRSRIYPWTDNKESRYSPFNDKTFKGKQAQAAKPDFFVITARNYSLKNLRKMKKAFPDAKIMIWSSRRPGHDRLLEKRLKNKEMAAQIDTIISDFPGKMVEHLKKKGFRA